MYIEHNYLRKIRKGAKVAQSDIAFIFGVKDFSAVSKWEQGLRIPDIKNLIGYELLLNATPRKIYQRQAAQIATTVRAGIEARIEYLSKEQPIDFRTRRRIASLEEILRNFNPVQQV